MTKATVVLLVAALMLAGCGSSETPGDDSSGPASPGGPVPDASPGGVYGGTLINTGASSSDTVGGVITENGDGFLVDSTAKAVYRLTPSTRGNTFTAAFKAYDASANFADGQSTETGTFTGTVQQHTSIDASYSASSNASGTIKLTYEPTVYQASVPLTTVAGTYQFMLTTGSTSDTLTFTFDSAGKLTGSDTAGCTFNGTLTIPDTQYNAQQLSFSESCRLTTRNYTGVSTYAVATSSTAASLVLEFDDGNTVAAVVKAVRQ